MLVFIFAKGLDISLINEFIEHSFINGRFVAVFDHSRKVLAHSWIFQGNHSLLPFKRFAFVNLNDIVVEVGDEISLELCEG